MAPLPWRAGSLDLDTSVVGNIDRIRPLVRDFERDNRLAVPGSVAEERIERVRIDVFVEDEPEFGRGLDRIDVADGADRVDDGDAGRRRGVVLVNDRIRRVRRSEFTDDRLSRSH